MVIFLLSWPLLISWMYFVLQTTNRIFMSNITARSTNRKIGRIKYS